VPRWPRSWADLLPAAAGAGAVVLGLAAERSLYGFGNVGDWVPDLLTGWLLVGCGLVVLGVARTAGALLVAAGLLWFAGNFAGEAAYLLHRGPLAQLLVTFPGRRPAGRLETGAVAAVYTACLVSAFAWGDVATIALAGVIVAAAALRHRRAVGRLRRERAFALRGAAFLAVSLALVASANLLFDTSPARRATLRGYEASLGAVALYAAYGLRRRPWERPAVTDLVVELGEQRAEPVRDALARALGDPTLSVAYRVDGSYVDATGRPVDLPLASPSRRLTRVERDGREVAVLIHDAAMLDDPALLEAVSAATRLAAANASLQAEVRGQVDELDASRRRLLDTADVERRRLERRLHDGALRRLDVLAGVLDAARREAPPAVAARIGGAQEQLGKAATDLRELGAGLHPRELAEHGLAVALATLAEQSPVPVDLAIGGGRFPDEIETAIFFVCSEALANAGKHAAASRVSITVTSTKGVARAEIRDDGAGGADPAGGTGLRGLADRVEALGGRLQVADGPAGGTLVAVELPLY
jgi:signal transduction histidine kinase